MKDTIILIFLALITSYGYAQNPIVRVDFNDCQIQDSGPQNISLVSGGNPLCICGLNGDALDMDGIDDHLSMNEDLSFLFNKDFTLSLYIRIDNNPNYSGTVDVLSLQKECKRDSSFTLKYIPSIRELRLDIVKNLSRSTQINVRIDEGKCWQHIMVRRGFEYSIYLNGRLAGRESAVTDYFFSPEARLALSNSPCLGVSDVRMEGAVEQWLIFDKALNEIEIMGLDLFPDHIMTSDTTLLLGESLQIDMGPTCSESFYWTNPGDLDDPFSLTPIITPAESSTYQIFFDNGVCTSVDSIRVYIQDPQDLQCDQLLLPNAFTPNGDQLNETFEISNKFIVEELERFDIYSRQGNRVFSGTSKFSAWDGIYLGTRLNPGKFAYVIEYTCRGESYQKSGIVNLIR